MMRDDMDGSWLPATEIERTLDRVIDGLAKMDAEILMQLARLCSDWDAKGRASTFPMRHTHVFPGSCCSLIVCFGRRASI